MGVELSKEKEPEKPLTPETPVEPKKSDEPEKPVESKKTEEQKKPEPKKSGDVLLERMLKDFLTADSDQALARVRGYWELALNKLFHETQLRADEIAEQRRSSAEGDLEMFRSVISYGQATLKTFLFVNGGAAVALLAFMGHLATNKEQMASVALFTDPMRYWCWGIFLAALATGVTYLCQRVYSMRKQVLGHVISVITVILAFASLILFLVGCYSAEKQFQKMPTKPVTSEQVSHDDTCNSLRA